MSHYYFDLHNGDGPLQDEDGTELTSRCDIVREAAKILLDVARDELPSADRAPISITVRDEDGKTISVSTLIFTHEWL
jgi:hypothetical protein